MIAIEGEEENEEEEKTSIFRKYMDFLLDILGKIGLFILFSLHLIYYAMPILLLVSIIIVGYGLDIDTDTTYKYENYEILEKEVNEEAWFFTHYFVINESGDREAVSVGYEKWLEAEIGDNYVTKKRHSETTVYVYDRKIMEW